MQPLLIATGNAGKVRELSVLLPGIELRTLKDAPAMTLDEPGEDYLSNAVAKAWVASRESGWITLADDSGLEVDALGGSPGWRSARYGGGHGDDAANRAMLTRMMLHVPDGRRAAQFRCVVAVADAQGPLGTRVLLGMGACVGAIAREERGANGFGYDPMLTLAGFTQTMAELDDATKNAHSHRARAVTAVLPALMAYLASRPG